MNNMINDLDCQLANEFYFGANGYRTAQPISSEIKVGDNLTVVSLADTVQPKPRTTTTTTTTTTQEPKPRTAATTTESVTSIPRPLPPTTEPAPEEVVEEEAMGMPIFGGGGGGGSAARMSEEGGEEGEGVVLPPAPKKIFGLSPKVFYGILGVAGLGTFLYFKIKKNK